MFVTNWISTTKIQKISEITNFFRHYFLSRTEVDYTKSSLISRGAQKIGTGLFFLYKYKYDKSSFALVQMSF